MSRFKIGIQLYTVREPLRTDFEGTLKKLSAMGIRGVELAFFYGGLEPTPLAELMKKLDLAICGIYETLDNVENPDAKVYEYAKALNCKYLTGGLKPDAFQNDFAACVTKLKNAVGTAKAKGLSFCYHAHSHEFRKIDGEYIMDKILADIPEMAFEADTAWIKCGGEIPEKYIRTHLSRIPIMHFKDVEADNSITELGNGIIDFQEVLNVIRNSNVEWVSYEQDSSDLTPIESTEISIKYFKKIIGE